MEYKLTEQQVEDFIGFCEDYLNKTRRAKYSLKILKVPTELAPSLKVHIQSKLGSERHAGIYELTFNNYSTEWLVNYPMFVDWNKMYLMFMHTVFGDAYLEDAVAAKDQEIEEKIKKAHGKYLHTVKTENKNLEEYKALIESIRTNGVNP